MSTPGRVGKETIRQLFERNGIPEPRFYDEWYSLPALDWITHEGNAAIYRRILNDVGLYDPEDGDCDDFARCAAEEVRACQRATKDKPQDSAIAFGTVIYLPDRGKGQTAHCINVFVHRGDGGVEDLHLGFFEPQTCRIVQLSPTEIKSCQPPEF